MKQLAYSSEQAFAVKVLDYWQRFSAECFQSVFNCQSRVIGPTVFWVLL